MTAGLCVHNYTHACDSLLSNSRHVIYPIKNRVFIYRRRYFNHLRHETFLVWLSLKVLEHVALTNAEM